MSDREIALAYARTADTQTDALTYLVTALVDRSPWIALGVWRYLRRSRIRAEKRGHTFTAKRFAVAERRIRDEVRESQRAWRAHRTRRAA